MNTRADEALLSGILVPEKLRLKSEDVLLMEFRNKRENQTLSKGEAEEMRRKKGRKGKRKPGIGL